MRNQTVVVAATVVVVAVIAGAAAVVVAFGRTHQIENVKGAAPLSTPVTSSAAQPTPTVTVTKRKVVRETVEVPAPAPRYRGGDAEFLAMIARDGIKAPDGWAIEAGRETCGTGNSYAYDYLTDGGIYGYHVQTFIDDWTSSHGGC